MTKRLSMTEKLARATARKGLKSQRDLFSDVIMKTQRDVLSGNLLLRTPSHEPATVDHTIPKWGPISGAIYERAKDPVDVIDESRPEDVPYAQPYFSVSEYVVYRDDMTRDTRSWFLLLVAFCLKSDGL